MQEAGSRGDKPPLHDPISSLLIERVVKFRVRENFVGADGRKN